MCARPRSAFKPNGDAPLTVTAVSEKSGSARSGFGAGEQPEMRKTTMQKTLLNNTQNTF